MTTNVTLLVNAQLVSLAQCVKFLRILVLQIIARTVHSVYHMPMTISVFVHVLLTLVKIVRSTMTYVHSKVPSALTTRHVCQKAVTFNVLVTSFTQVINASKRLILAHTVTVSMEQLAYQTLLTTHSNVYVLLISLVHYA